MSGPMCTDLDAFFPSVLPAMQSTIRPSTPYLLPTLLSVHKAAVACALFALCPGILPQESFLHVPNYTQDPHRLRLIKVCEQRSFFNRLALFSKPKRKSCTCSTDRAPRHGDHDVRSHGLDQGNGTVDGLSPAVKLLVKFEEGNCKETHPETLQLCSRRALRSSRSGNCHRWWTSFNAPIWTNPVKPNVSTKPNLISIIKDATHKLQRLP